MGLGQQKLEASSLGLLLWMASAPGHIPTPMAEMRQPRTQIASIAAFSAGPSLEHLRDAPAPLARPAHTAAPPISPIRSDWRPARLNVRLIIPLPKETAAYKRTFKILLSNLDKTDRYDDIIVKYAVQYRLSPRLLKAIIAAESEFDPMAVSPRGARGLMQLTPATAEEMGIPEDQLHDPDANIHAGAKYLHALFVHASGRYRIRDRHFARAPLWLTERVVAAYNAGPRFLDGMTLHDETQLYVRKVVLFFRTHVTDLHRQREL